MLDALTNKLGTVLQAYGYESLSCLPRHTPASLALDMSYARVSKGLRSGPRGWRHYEEDTYLIEGSNTETTDCSCPSKQKSARQRNVGAKPLMGKELEGFV